ncbi:hypothetical protein C8J56DRAFT_936111 [Mycena floridula]|nr:hypothetical protein C8J56DRAFT_936111 [Mycena floridula]
MSVAMDFDKENKFQNLSGPAQKKKRTTRTSTGSTDNARWSKVRGKRALLHHFVQAPLDVLFEIFGYLEPLDVLRLSRTSKDLRNILNKSAALFNVQGLPTMPVDMNELQYAILLFDTYCQVCLFHRCDNVIVECRIRCCKKCLPKAFVSWTALKEKYQGIDETFRTIQGDIPHTFVDGRGHWRGQCIAFPPLIVEEYLNEYLEVKDSPLFETWRERIQSDARIRRKHQQECVTWRRQLAQAREDDLEKTRVRRREDVQAIGWGPEIKKMSKKEKRDWQDHKLVNQPKDITDRSWNNMQSAMVEIMEAQKVLRLKREKATIMMDRYSGLQYLYSDFLNDREEEEDGEEIARPGLGDVFTWPVFAKLLNETPINKVLTLADFDPGFESLPKLISQWQQKALHKLRRLLQKSLPDATAKDVMLAKTIFTCNHCNEPLWYPRTLTHGCLSINDRRILAQNNQYSFDPFEVLGWKSWDVNGLKYSKSASRNAVKVIEQFGLDPEEATAEDLDEEDLLLECEECESETEGRLLMRWQRALSHPSHTFITDSVSLLDENEAVELEEENRCGYRAWIADAGRGPVRCNICQSRVGSFFFYDLHLELQYVSLSRPAFQC